MATFEKGDVAFSRRANGSVRVYRGQVKIGRKGTHMIDKMKKDTQQTQSNKLFSDERIDPLLSQVQSKDAESLLGETGLAGQLKKRLAERMLEAELSHHLKQQNAQGKTDNHRNGGSAKTGITPAGNCRLDIPRDRFSTLDPALIAKEQRRWPGFKDHVIRMDA